jgi:pyruvate-formate lyase
VNLCKWWQGKTVADEIESRLSYDQLKCSEAGKKIFQTNLYHYAGVGHLAADYAYILRRGFDGIIEDIQAQEAKLDMHDPYFADKRDSYDAMIVCMNAAKIWTHRYAELAESMAKDCKDEKRKAELETMAANLRQVAGGPAKSFWQALQLFNIATVLIQTEGTATPFLTVVWTVAVSVLQSRYRCRQDHQGIRPGTDRRPVRESQLPHQTEGLRFHGRAEWPWVRR